MGHQITALIGSVQSLRAVAQRFGPPSPTVLPFDLSILPLDHGRLDQLSGDTELPSYDGFIYLGPELDNGIASGSSEGKILYIETAYFGGVGSQAAALFEAGRLTWREANSNEPEAREHRSWFNRFLKPHSNQIVKSPISQGLAMLGVPTSIDGDEFDAIGLGRFRSLEELGLSEWDDESEDQTD